MALGFDYELFSYLLFSVFGFWANVILVPPPKKKIQAAVVTVHRHFVDLRGVVLLDVAQDPDVVVLDEVDGDTLATEATWAERKLLLGSCRTRDLKKGEAISTLTPGDRLNL